MKPYIKKIVSFILLACFILICFTACGSSDTDKAPQVDKGALKSKLDRYIANCKPDVSVIVCDIDSKEPLYEYDGDVKIPSASTIKVPVMLAAFDDVKNGKYKLTDKISIKKADIVGSSDIFEGRPGQYTLEELIFWMIVKSDNTATNFVIDKVGMDKVNDYMKNTLKLKSSELNRIMLDSDAAESGKENYTSEEDMLKLFKKLFKKEILNDELCDKAIDILNGQRHFEQVNRYIPANVEYAHKTGTLSYVNHDCGVMHIGDKYYYVGVSVYNYEKKDYRPAAGELGKIIYDCIS